MKKNKLDKQARSMLRRFELPEYLSVYVVSRYLTYQFAGEDRAMDNVVGSMYSELVREVNRDFNG